MSDDAVCASAVWAERALTPDGWASRVRVQIADGRISDVQHGVDPEPADERFDACTLAPGLVDLQVNGGDGAAYDDADPEVRARASDWHLARGTTSLLATLVTSSLERLEAALRRLADDVDPAGPVLGVHLEGPFLSEHKSGAHAAGVLCDPTPEAVARMLDAAGGTLRMVTLAPEREGALDAVETLASSGAIVAAGHSIASLERVRAALDRGLSFVTHVGNASEWPARPFDSELGYRRSEPGLIGAFMIEERLRGSVILDGRHLHPALAGALRRLRGDALILVSDATPAAGLPPGRYRMGGLDAQIHPEGYATVLQGLAGSTISLLDAVRTAVQHAGIPLDDALRMASCLPARIIGADDKGRLERGADADLLVLDADLSPHAVFRAGRPIHTQA